MTIVIVDNGKGAQQLASMIRGKTQIVSPSKIPDATGYILSDGDMKFQKENTALIEKTTKPVLGIGIGSVFLAMSFGATRHDAVPQKNVKLTIEKRSPITLDLKKVISVVKNCGHGIEDMPENFEAVAHSPSYPFEIVQEQEKPFFGVHFNPEEGGEGMKIMQNFVSFVDVWARYHK
ncbi:MAG: hypothetical protein HY832_00280 [Candidatus Aenigmarchaeota archaeon]|nr:hypothetical protein [Candidatus Aenigmarchaeota archaeon]